MPGQGARLQFFQRDEYALVGAYAVDIADMRDESFKDALQFSKIFIGYFPFLPKNFVNPIIFLHDVGVTQDIPSPVVFYYIASIQYGSMAPSWLEEQ